MAITFRAWQAATGQSASFTVESGDTLIVCCANANPSSTGTIDSITWNGVAMTAAIATLRSADFILATRIFYLNDPAVGTFTLAAAGTGIDGWNGLIMAKTNGDRASGVGGTGTVSHTLNDLISPSVSPTAVGQHVFYAGGKGGAGTPAWDGVASQSGFGGTDFKMAEEAASDSSSTGSWGEAGVDDEIIAMGVSLIPLEIGLKSRVFRVVQVPPSRRTTPLLYGFDISRFLDKLRNAKRGSLWPV